MIGERLGPKASPSGLDVLPVRDSGCSHRCWMRIQGPKISFSSDWVGCRRRARDLSLGFECDTWFVELGFYLWHSWCGGTRGSILGNSQTDHHRCTLALVLLDLWERNWKGEVGRNLLSALNSLGKRKFDLIIVYLWNLIWRWRGWMIASLRIYRAWSGDHWSSNWHLFESSCHVGETMRQRLLKSQWHDVLKITGHGSVSWGLEVWIVVIQSPPSINTVVT